MAWHQLRVDAHGGEDADFVRLLAELDLGEDLAPAHDAFQPQRSAVVHQCAGVNGGLPWLAGVGYEGRWLPGVADQGGPEPVWFVGRLVEHSCLFPVSLVAALGLVDELHGRLRAQQVCVGVPGGEEYAVCGLALIGAVVMGHPSECPADGLAMDEPAVQVRRATACGRCR